MFVARSKGVPVLGLLLVILASPCLNGQAEIAATAARVATAARTSQPPRMDGTLEDPIWATAPAVTDFRQKEPLETQPGTEKTEIHIFFALLTIGIVLNRSGVKGSKQPPIISLAVLPLKNLSGDPTEEYLADGMTESLIGRLSSIHDLRVISRTSVMRFKDKQLSVPEIARTVRVDAIVEGSVMREGNRIRVHAQLIRALTDEHFWSVCCSRSEPLLEQGGRGCGGRAVLLDHKPTSSGPLPYSFG